jgi:hypothetical protein
MTQDAFSESSKPSGPSLPYVIMKIVVFFLESWLYFVLRGEEVMLVLICFGKTAWFKELDLDKKRKYFIAKYLSQ